MKPPAVLFKVKSFASDRLPQPFQGTPMRKLLALTAGALALVILTIAVANHPAWSQAARTFRVVITVPPGGSIDILFRLLADQISTTRGQTIIVESRPGAGGVIAAEAVARAAADGNTLLSNNNGIIISAILRKVNYDPLTSFEPICYLVSTPQIVVVNSASPYRTLAELLDAARSKPGELSIASVGPNTTQHLGIERLKRLAGANLTYVSYPGGAATANALLGAHVTSAVLNWSEVGEHVIAGKARALATMALHRIESLPDLPTVSESGYKDFETDVWFGLVAPAKTPKETVSQLIDWFREALLAPPVKTKLIAQALYPNPKCGADFAAHLRRQSDLFTQLIRELNIKTE
jgi:tripartite-type tricarboxylate transporter receptor subunit TctC